MKNFLTLISIENTKLWKRLSSKVMIIILVVIILAATGIVKYYNVTHKPEASKTTTEASTKWKEELQAQSDATKIQIAKTEKSSSKSEKVMLSSMRKNVAENEYRIKNDIKPSDSKSIWTSVSDFNGMANYSQLIALLLMITCAAVVAGEFSEGTMKMMITRPYKRHEILTAKLAATTLYGLELMGITIVLSILLQGLYYGFNEPGAKEMLWTGSKIIYIPAALKTFIMFGLDFLQVLVYVIVAFVISAISRSRSIATGFSLFLLLVGTGIIQMLAMFFNWCKFLPFGLTNFKYFINAGSYIDGTSLGFALIVSAVYSVIFCFIGYYTFQKRDI